MNDIYLRFGEVVECVRVETTECEDECESRCKSKS